MSKIQYLNIALGGTAERTSMLHQVRSALIWLWIRQTSYFRRHFIVFHLVQCCTLDIVWYSWVRDIAVHLETDLDNFCSRLETLCSTSYFILFKRPPPRQPPSFDPSALLLFVPVLWDKNGFRLQFSLVSLHPFRPDLTKLTKLTQIYW